MITENKTFRPTVLYRLLFACILLSIAFTGIAQNWNELIKITPADRGSQDSYGNSVSIFENYAIVGAINEDHDISGGNPIVDAGAAYLFEKDSSGNWIEVQKLVAFDRNTQDYFGVSVSISGNHAIVGAYKEDEDSNSGNTLNNAGSAYIYKRDSLGTWNFIQKIVASDRSSYDQFGETVSISGEYALIGAIGEDEDASGNNTLTDAGSAYIFKRNNFGVWVEVQKIVASDRYMGNYFGNSISIFESVAIIGAPKNSYNAVGNNPIAYTGSAYIFERNASGVWNQVQKIVAADRGYMDYFGNAVSIYGEYALVGALKDDDDVNGNNPKIDAGSAYLFKRNSSGIWNQVQKIVASDRGTQDFFGESVAISKDLFIIGAAGENEDANGNNSKGNSGSAYLFEKYNSGVWNQVQKIVASDRARDDSFGTSVSIDDRNAIVGAIFQDTDSSGGNYLTDAGAAYIFRNLCPLTGIANNTICFLDTIYINGTAYHNSNTTGTETLLSTSLLNCDSIVSISLNVLPAIDTTVSIAQGMITANQNGATYHWIDCNNGNDTIPFATNQNYYPTMDGNYAVIIGINGCTDTSSCQRIIGVGLVENGFNIKPSIYPNPTDGHFSIDLGKEQHIILISITDLTGRLIQSKSFLNRQLINFSFEEPKGMYLLNIVSDHQSASFRLTKE